MTENNGNNHRLQRAADNAILQLAARVVIVLALPAGAWMGGRLVDAIDGMAGKIAAIEIKVERMGVDIEYLKRDVSSLNGR